ncbi:MAG: hypothetical protein IT350_02770 [Deltaproteobacteria bacterium]|nr:hypothetical protein [Deltaproteobacteria bacterium]
MTQFRAATPGAIAKYLLAHRQRVKLSFWLGAGASTSSGIPGADDLAAAIHARFPYLPDEPDNRVDSPYAQAFNRLRPFSQRTFLNEVNDGARTINWTHLLLTQLVNTGWVNLILTSNFDTLPVRSAHFLHDAKPRFVDLARDVKSSAEGLEPGTVVYLNGMADNHAPASEESLKRHDAVILQMLYRAALDSVVIVLGYSGRRDPLFDRFARMPEAGNGLFWVTRDPEPDAHVQEEILGTGRYADFLGKTDADRFMAELVLAGMGLPDPEPLADRERYWADHVAQIDVRPIGGNGTPPPWTPPAPSTPPPVSPPSSAMEATFEDTASAVEVAEADLIADARVHADLAAKADESMIVEPQVDEPEVDEPAPAQILEAEVTFAQAAASVLDVEPVEDVVEEPTLTEDVYEPTNGFHADEMIGQAQEALVMGDTDDLIEIALKAFEMEVTDAFDELTETLLEYGRELFGHENLKDSKRVFEMAVQLSPDRPEPWRALADLARRMGDHAAARSLDEKARERNGS